MKMQACRCCDGTGKELDNAAVGREMRALRHRAGLSLLQLGDCMKPKLKKTYLHDLEHGRRNWTLALVEGYRKACQ